MPVNTPPIVQPFLDYLRYEKRYSENTLISYTTDLADFFDFLKTRFEVVSWSEIGHPMIRSWLASLKDKGMTGKTINRKISVLKSFFKFGLKTGAIDSNPMGKVISQKVSAPLPVFMREEDTSRLITVLEQSSEDWKTLNAKMLISIFYATGMRLSELLGLKEKQLDFERKQVKVLGKGNKERIIPVSPELLELIREYQLKKNEKFGTGGEYLLVTEKGRKLYPKYAWLLVNTWLGVSATLDKRSPHVLRHTFATHLMNSGAGLNAVKELLGHSSLAATQVYTHNSIGKLKDVHKKSHPRA